MFALPWDRHKYIEMASGNPFEFHIAPYCWRVGKPLLVKLLPMGLETSFLAISFASVALAGILSWLLAREVGFSRWIALTGVLFFFALQWGPKFFLYEFWLPDSTIFMLVLLAVLLIVRGNLTALALVVAAGVMVKESMLFVLPLVYTFGATKLVDWPAARRTLLVALPAVLVFVMLRLAIPPWNDDPAYVATLPEKLWLVRDGGSEYDVLDAFRQETRNRLTRLDLDEARDYLFGTFGLAMTLLPVFALDRNWSWLVRFSPFLILVAAQMLFGHDIGRYLILAFPAWLILALNGLESLGERLEVPESSWGLIPLLLMVFELALQDPYFLPLRYHALALALALGLIAVITRIRPNRPPQTTARKSRWAEI